MIKLHTTEGYRAELRENAEGALKDLKSVSGMILCGQIITLLDDIDTLVAALEDDDE